MGSASINVCCNREMRLAHAARHLCDTIVIALKKPRFAWAIMKCTTTSSGNGAINDGVALSRLRRDDCMYAYFVKR